jgi:hypothetical protein
MVIRKGGGIAADDYILLGDDTLQLHTLIVSNISALI